MKKVYIKYNPYKLETEITVDGKPLAQNSKIGECCKQGSRLQEWVEELPENLIDEYNDNEFDVKFYGTLMDYEDLADVFNQAYELGTVEKLELDRIPAKETADKEKLIDKLFHDIQQGPFEELKDDSIINAFKQAKSDEFEVCVVATMSSGKSTLINSMLGTKLMPSMQEACTAIITKIKDNDSHKGWQAEVYDKDGKLNKTYKNLTLQDMKELNANSEVGLIKATGDIPFVSSEETSLVLIDTPGPNNARNNEHREIQSKFLNKNSKKLILYVTDATFGKDDDHNLLKQVADSMKVGGKQSRDRFIFVLNKLDDRQSDEDGDLVDTIYRLKKYLENHGIDKPNIFPATALLALNIRLLQNNELTNRFDKRAVNLNIEIFNDDEGYYYLEKFAPLPKSISQKIEEDLENASDDEEGNAAKALIHTGIPSIEAAINQYVSKYAKTAKIKNIVDTFIHKLEEANCYESIKKDLAENTKNSAQIAEQIEFIAKEVDDANSAVRFKTVVDTAVERVSNEAVETIDDIVAKYQNEITNIIDKAKGKEIMMDEIEHELGQLKIKAKELEPRFQSDLDNLIQETLVKTSNALIDEYKHKLASLTSKLDNGSFCGITIEPLKLMGSTVLHVDDFKIKNMMQEKKVVDGEEWVENTDKKWYKPWTWFDEDGYFRKNYKSVKYISADELAQVLLAPIQEEVYDNGDASQEYAKNQAKRIAEYFNDEFEYLDGILKEKLAELKSYATDKDKADRRLKETEKRLQWLNDINKRIEDILEI